jgi:phosphonate transport system substrate-binding protein
MKKGSIKIIQLVFLLMVIIVGLAACGSEEENIVEPAPAETKDESTVEKEELTFDTFKVGVIPALTEGDFQAPMQKLEVVLNEALPFEVEITTYPDYNGVVEALNFGHIQMAYLGPSTYVTANHHSGAQAIVATLIDGEPFYNSLIITHVDAPWNTLDEIIADVGNTSFAFGDHNSTSGSLVPSIELRDRGVFTDENTHEFKNVTYTGSHDATGLAVQNKHVHAGAIDSAYFNSLIKQGKLDGSKFKTVWTSEPLFQYPWAVASTIDQQTIKVLQDTFLSIQDEEILKVFGATGFTTATDADYEPVRKLMIESGKLK